MKLIYYYKKIFDCRNFERKTTKLTKTNDKKIKNDSIEFFQMNFVKIHHIKAFD